MNSGLLLPLIELAPRKTIRFDPPWVPDPVMLTPETLP